MSRSITQDIAYRQFLMKYTEKYGVSRARQKYTKAGHTSISGKPGGMAQCNLYPVSPDALAAILIITQAELNLIRDMRKLGCSSSHEEKHIQAQLYEQMTYSGSMDQFQILCKLYLRCE